MYIKKRKDDKVINYVAIPGLLNDTKLKFNKASKDESLDFLMSHVLRETGVSEKSFQSKSRQREYVEARHIFCYLARKLTSCALREIGEKIGARDHTTVVHSVRTAKDLIETSGPFAEKVAAVESNLLGFNIRILKYEVIADIRA